MNKNKGNTFNPTAGAPRPSKGFLVNVKKHFNSLSYPLILSMNCGALIGIDILSAFSKAGLRFPILYEVPPMLLRHCNSVSLHFGKCHLALRKPNARFYGAYST
jgi:hypothetical protein